MDYTVTQNDFWKDNEPYYLNKTLKSILHELGVINMVVGHKPHIDNPLEIKSELRKKQGHIQEVSTDTSQNKIGAQNIWGADNRGVKTKSEVIVQEDGNIRLHGQLDNGKTQDFRLNQ